MYAALLATALTLVTSAPAQADCRDVLLFGRTSRAQAYSLQQSFAYLLSVDQSHFEAAKHDVETDMTVLVPPVAAAFGGDYHAFQQRRDELLQNTQINWTSDERYALDESFLADAAINAWKSCIAAGRGFGMIVKSASETDVAILFYNSVPNPGTSRFAVLESSVSGASDNPLGARAPRVFPRGYTFGPNDDRLVVFHRAPGEPFVLSVHVQGSQSEMIRLPAPEEPMGYCHVATSNPQGFGIVMSGGTGTIHFDCPRDILNTTWRTGDLVLSAAHTGMGCPDPKNYTWEIFLNNDVVLTSRPMPTFDDNYHYRRESVNLPAEALKDVGIGNNLSVSIGSSQPSCATFVINEVELWLTRSRQRSIPQRQ